MADNDGILLEAPFRVGFLIEFKLRIPARRHRWSKRAHAWHVKADFADDALAIASHWYSLEFVDGQP